MNRKKIAEWARGMATVFEESPKGISDEMLFLKIRRVLDGIHARKERISTTTPKRVKGSRKGA